MPSLNDDEEHSDTHTEQCEVGRNPPAYTKTGRTEKSFRLS